MADDQKKKPVTGGNTPKPPARSGGPSNQSAKDRSKAQSRPVSGKSPAGKSGQATGAPPSRAEPAVAAATSPARAASPRPRRSPADSPVRSWPGAR